MKKNILAVALFLLGITSPILAVEFSADEITSTGVESTGKVYFKSQDVHRNDSGMGVISLTKRPMMYLFFTETKRYVVSNVEEANDNPMANIQDFDDFAKKNQLKKVGSETIEGFACEIYKGTIQLGDSLVPSKLWYSRKLNYPVKTEMETPMGKMGSRLQNIRIGKQPDRLFEILPGYTKAKDTQEAMGISIPQVPTSGEMNPKEMEKMMKQMQEMMKKQQGGQ